MRFTHEILKDIEKQHKELSDLWDAVDARKDLAIDCPEWEDIQVVSAWLACLNAEYILAQEKAKEIKNLAEYNQSN